MFGDDISEGMITVTASLSQSEWRMRWQMIFQANPELRNREFTLYNFEVKLGMSSNGFTRKNERVGHFAAQAEMNKKGTSKMEVSIASSEAKTSVVLLQG